MRLNKCLTVEEVINGLLDQALDKRRIAGEDKYSIFIDDAVVLENAALMLDASHEEEPARLLTEVDFANNPDVDALGHLPCWVDEYGADDGHWGLVTAACVDDPRVRFWTKQPTKQQMEEMPWG